MSALAVTFFIIAAVVIWGGLVASVVFLTRKPEVDDYPEGGEDGPALE